MKIRLQEILLLTLLAVFCTALVAQDNAMSAKPMPEKAAQGAPPMPKPAPEMTRLIKLMAGNWTVTEKAEPNPMMPNGGTGTGTARMWAGPGRMSLLENYHSSGMMGANFAGFGTFWWDAKAQVGRGVWCDSMSPQGCDDSGTTKWEGDKLVGTMEGVVNGQKNVTRFTYSDWKPDSFVMTMEMGPDVNSLKPAMTITYTRAAAAGKMEKPAQ